MVCPSVSGLGDDCLYICASLLVMLYSARVIFNVLLPRAIMSSEYTGCALNSSVLEC